MPARVVLALLVVSGCSAPAPAWDTWRFERYYTSYATDTCDLPQRLYCFEDGYQED